MNIYIFRNRYKHISYKSLDTHKHTHIYIYIYIDINTYLPSLAKPRLGPWFVWKSSLPRATRRSFWVFLWPSVVVAFCGISPPKKPNQNGRSTTWHKKKGKHHIFMETKHRDLYNLYQRVFFGFATSKNKKPGKEEGEIFLNQEKLGKIWRYFFCTVHF